MTLLQPAPYPGAHVSLQQAGHLVARVSVDRFELGIDPLVRLAYVRATRVEEAPRRPVDEARWPTRDRHELLPPGGIEPGDGLQQTPRVGMLRGVEDRFRRRVFDDPSGVHHADIVSDRRDHAE